jgi:hypothetical protein
MRDLFILIVHLVTTIFRLAKPGGLRAVVAESVLAKHQLLILAVDTKKAQSNLGMSANCRADQPGVRNLY